MVTENRPISVGCPFCHTDITAEVERATVSAFKAAEQSAATGEVPVACTSCRGAFNVLIDARIVLRSASITSSTPPARIKKPAEPAVEENGEP